MRSNIFDRLSFLSLFLVIVLLPPFSLPFTKIPVETSKGLLLVLGLALTIVFWAIARFFDGKIILPKSWLLVSGLGIAVVFLLSALMSGNSEVSLFGTMFDIGSFWFIFAGFILMLMSSLVFRTPTQAKLVLLGIILSSFIVLVFQSAHLFLPDVLSLGILSGKTGNLLGSWNALGLFAGFSALMFLLQIEFFPVSKVGKILLQLFILLSILVATTINFPLVWILLGISALIIFVYKAFISFSMRDEDGQKDKSFPAVSFIVVMISLLFFVSGQFIGNIIPNYLKISNTEVGPSFLDTMSATKNVLLKDPVFGLGPNRFEEAWSMYKPTYMNKTQFWDVAFNSGFGLLFTLTATTGGLGIAAWLIFLILFLVNGVKSVFSSVKSGTNWEMMAFFVLSLYLFISMLFYSTGAVTFLLALAFTGVFIGLSASIEGKEISISFLNDHRKSFFSIMALIILMIFSVAATFKFAERLASVAYFGRALSAATVPDAEISIGRALSLYTNDLYLRTYSQIYLVKLDSLVKKGSALGEEEKADLQTSFDRAVRSAELAVAYNPSNYLNYKLLGVVYQTAGILGAKDAYPKAVAAYENASKLNPLNPGLKIAIASALNADGKTKEAITYAEAALHLAPTNQDIANYLKSLQNGTPALETPATENETDE
ncbi:hypothetical protein HYW73_01755 [Candidatus Nomurabacteria bacterium]|nr:hypothetical protein [Candidatus Nomurabacteria bacterium]